MYFLATPLLSLWSIFKSFAHFLIVLSYCVLCMFRYKLFSCFINSCFLPDYGLPFYFLTVSLKSRGNFNETYLSIFLLYFLIFVIFKIFAYLKVMKIFYLFCRSFIVLLFTFRSTICLQLTFLVRWQKGESSFFKIIAIYLFQNNPFSFESSWHLY